MLGQYIKPAQLGIVKNAHLEIVHKNVFGKKRKVKSWSNLEDQMLVEIYSQYPKKWSQIAELMDQRNENQCLHRYRRLSQLGASKKNWTAEQDEKIKKLVKRYGRNWKMLSEVIGTKTGKQIRERFINKLDPRIKKEEWKQEEDRKIIQLYSAIGSRWSEISKKLSGRPQNKVKNRFYSYIQKNYAVKLWNSEKSADATIEQKQQIEETSVQKKEMKAERVEREQIKVQSRQQIEESVQQQNMEHENILQQRINTGLQQKICNYIPSLSHIDNIDKIQIQNIHSRISLKSYRKVEDDWQYQRKREQVYFEDNDHHDMFYENSL